MSLDGKESVRLRRTASALSLLAALLLAIAALFPLLRPVPAQIHAAEHGGTIDFWVDTPYVLTSTDCLIAHWRVDNIRELSVNGRGVVSEGSRLSCSEEAELEVTYQDGFQQSYSISKRVLIESLITRTVILGALAAFGLALAISGVLSVPVNLVRRTRRRNEPSALPPIPERQSKVKLSPVLFSAVLLIILIGSAVRVHYLDMALSFDESWMYVDFASQPLSTIVTDYHANNNHILLSIFVHASTAAFGLSLWSLRLPTFLAGVMVIAATFALGRRFYNDDVGLLAAALVAVSPWLIEFSDNARGYSPITLITLLMLLLADRLRSRPTRKDQIAFTLLGIAGMYVVPSMAYAIAMICAWLGLMIVLNNRGRHRRWLLRNMAESLLLMGGITAVLYVPPYLYMRSHTTGLDVGNFDSVSWGAFVASQTREWVLFWQELNRGVPPAAGALLAVGFITGTLFHARQAAHRISLAAVAVVTLPALLFLQLVTTYARLWLFLAPLYLLVASSGLIDLGRLAPGRRWRPRAGAFIVVVVIATGVVTIGRLYDGSVVSDGYGGRPAGADVAMQWLRDHADTKAAVLCVKRCELFKVYGMLYNVGVKGTYSNVEKLNQVYMVDYDYNNRPIKMSEALETVDVPQTQFEPVVVLKSGIVVLFRLIPTEPPTALIEKSVVGSLDLKHSFLAAGEAG